MSTAAHTPGPWRAVFDIGNPDGSQWGVQTDKGLWVCDCLDNAGPRRGAGRPNAYLMAAAPDLLAALKAVIRDDAENKYESGLSVTVCAQAIAAIARATGEHP